MPTKTIYLVALTWFVGCVGNTSPTASTSPPLSQSGRYFILNQSLVLTPDHSAGPVFATQGPGTLEIRLDWDTSPPNLAASVFLFLRRCPDMEGVSLCRAWVDLAEVTGEEKPKDLTHLVTASGRQEFVVMALNRGPNVAYARLQGWFTTQR